MIKRIILENFQSHSHSVIEINENFNAIVGVSDSGKSAIRRAIQCVSRRAPFYLKHGTREGSVTIEFSDCVVKREYKKINVTKCPHCKENLGTNKCFCRSCDKLVPDRPASDIYYVDDEKYEKFGTQIPPMIAEKLRICEVLFGDFPVNISIQHQHEDMFFIGSSYNGNARNKMIMGLVPDAERVDGLVKDMNSEKNEMRNELKYMEKEFSENSSKLDLLKKDIEELESQYSEIESIEAQLKSLEQTHQLLEQYREALCESKYITRIGGFIERNGLVMEKAQTFLDKIEIRVNRNIEIKGYKETLTSLTIRDITLPDGSELEENHILTKIIEKDSKLSGITQAAKSLQNLTLLNVEIPVFQDNVNQVLDLQESIQKQVLGIEEYKNICLTVNSELSTINIDIDSVNDERDVCQKQFREENAHLICPHRNDVYADECLEKFVK